MCLVVGLILEGVTWQSSENLVGWLIASPLNGCSGETWRLEALQGLLPFFGWLAQDLENKARFTAGVGMGEIFCGNGYDG